MNSEERDIRVEDVLKTYQAFLDKLITRDEALQLTVALYVGKVAENLV